MSKLITALVFLFCPLAFALPHNGPNVTSIRTAYTVTPVTTAAPIVLISSMPHTSGKLSIFDSSGNVMQLIITKNGVSDYLIIPPGGGGFSLGISQGSSVSIIALSANSTAGENDINFFY